MKIKDFINVLEYRYSIKYDTIKIRNNKVNLLLFNGEQSIKTRKAKNLGIRIITYEDFLNEMKNEIIKLLDFVLTECGDMTYTYRDNFNINECSILEIKKGFNLERIYYALYLLEKDHYVIIDSLYISRLELTDDDLRGNYLFLMKNLKVLLINRNDLNRLPKLPPNLIYLNCSDNRLPKLPKFPNTIKRVELFNYDGKRDPSEFDNFWAHHWPY